MFLSVSVDGQALSVNRQGLDVVDVLCLEVLVVSLQPVLIADLRQVDDVVYDVLCVAGVCVDTAGF